MVKDSLKAQNIIDKTYAKGDASVKFAESLGFDPTEFSTLTVNKRLAKVTKEFKEKTFREALMTGTEGAVAKLLATVWESALPKLIGRQAVQVMTGTTPSIRVPIASKAVAYQVGEIGGAPETAEKYTYTEIVARLWQCIPVVSRSLVEDCMWDVIERQYAEAGRAMAEAETNEILVGLIADAENTAAADTTNTLKLSDIAIAVGKIGSLNRDADTIILHPTDYAQLIQDTAISYVMYFGGNVAQTGIIPQLLGCNVLVSSKQTVKTCTVLDKAHAAVLFVRRDVTVEDYEDPIKDLAGAVVTSRFRYKIVDANSVYTITACSA